MSDLYHGDVSDEFILKLFETMHMCPQHRFQILTKRPPRLLRSAGRLPWPENVWQGVSIENNDVVRRADFLRKVPAAVRFLRMEPVMGSVDTLDLTGTDWVIVGRESGRNARPIEEEWILDALRRCRKARIPVFFKQWGGMTHATGGRTLRGWTYDFFPNPTRRWAPEFADSSSVPVQA